MMRALTKVKFLRLAVAQFTGTEHKQAASDDLGSSTSSSCFACTQEQLKQLILMLKRAAEKGELGDSRPILGLLYEKGLSMHSLELRQTACEAIFSILEKNADLRMECVARIENDIFERAERLPSH